MSRLRAQPQHHAPTPGALGPKPIYRLSELAAMSGLNVRRLGRLLRRHDVRVENDGSGRGRERIVMLSALKEGFPDLVESIEMARKGAIACPACGHGVECTHCDWESA